MADQELRIKKMKLLAEKKKAMEAMAREVAQLELEMNEGGEGEGGDGGNKNDSVIISSDNSKNKQNETNVVQANPVNNVFDNEDIRLSDNEIMPGRIDRLSSFGRLSMSSLPVNCHLDKNEITLQGIVGRGSFGVVWKGLYRERQQVAVKLFLVEDVESEIVMLSRIEQHENVLNFLGVIFEVDDPYKEPQVALVTKYMSGGSLYDLLVDSKSNTYDQEGNVRFSFSKTVNMAYQAASGVGHLHGCGIIHRDLACRNLLVDENNSVAVADFGFARLRQKNESGNFSMTKTGPVRWEAPESLRLKQFSEATDAFSLAVTLWEMVCGRVPWQPFSTHGAAHAVLSGHRLPIPLNCDPSLGTVILKCWHEDPSQRMPLLEVRDALKARHLRLMEEERTTAEEISMVNNAINGVFVFKVSLIVVNHRESSPVRSDYRHEKTNSSNMSHSKKLTLGPQTLSNTLYNSSSNFTGSSSSSSSSSSGSGMKAKLDPRRLRVSVDLRKLKWNKELGGTTSGNATHGDDGDGFNDNGGGGMGGTGLSTNYIGEVGSSGNGSSKSSSSNNNDRGNSGPNYIGKTLYLTSIIELSPGLNESWPSNVMVMIEHEHNFKDSSNSDKSRATALNRRSLTLRTDDPKVKGGTISFVFNSVLLRDSWLKTLRFLVNRLKPDYHHDQNNQNNDEFNSTDKRPINNHYTSKSLKRQSSTPSLISSLFTPHSRNRSSSTSTSSSSIKWEFLLVSDVTNKPDGWYEFDSKANQDIETYYLDYKNKYAAGNKLKLNEENVPSLYITHPEEVGSDIQFKIDIENFTQQNISSMKTRPIRRIGGNQERTLNVERKDRNGGVNMSTTNETSSHDSPIVGVKWEYHLTYDPMGKPNGFYPFDENANNELELHYLEYKDFISSPNYVNMISNGSSFKSLIIQPEKVGFNYKIDIERMTQQNTRTGKVRQIRRVGVFDFFDKYPGTSPSLSKSQSHPPMSLASPTSSSFEIMSMIGRDDISHHHHHSRSSGSSISNTNHPHRGAYLLSLGDPGAWLPIPNISTTHGNKESDLHRFTYTEQILPPLPGDALPPEPEVELVKWRAVAGLKRGAFFLKMPSNPRGQPHERFIRVSPDLKEITWESESRELNVKSAVSIGLGFRKKPVAKTVKFSEVWEMRRECAIKTLVHSASSGGSTLKRLLNSSSLKSSTSSRSRTSSPVPTAISTPPSPPQLPSDSLQSMQQHEQHQEPVVLSHLVLTPLTIPGDPLSPIISSNQSTSSSPSSVSSNTSTFDSRNDKSTITSQGKDNDNSSQLSSANTSMNRSLAGDSDNSYQGSANTSANTSRNRGGGSQGGFSKSDGEGDSLFDYDSDGTLSDSETFQLDLDNKPFNGLLTVGNGNVRSHMGGNSSAEVLEEKFLKRFNQLELEEKQTAVDGNNTNTVSISSSSSSTSSTGGSSLSTLSVNTSTSTSTWNTSQPSPHGTTSSSSSANQLKSLPQPKLVQAGVLKTSSSFKDLHNNSHTNDKDNKLDVGNEKMKRRVSFSGKVNSAVGDAIRILRHPSFAASSSNHSPNTDSTSHTRSENSSPSIRPLENNQEIDNLELFQQASSEPQTHGWNSPSDEEVEDFSKNKPMKKKRSNSIFKKLSRGSIIDKSEKSEKINSKKEKNKELKKQNNNDAVETVIQYTIILYDKSGDVLLHLIAPNEKSYDLWVFGFDLMIRHSHQKRKVNPIQQHGNEKQNTKARGNVGGNTGNGGTGGGGGRSRGRGERGGSMSLELLEPIPELNRDSLLSENGEPMSPSTPDHKQPNSQNAMKDDTLNQVEELNSSNASYTAFGASADFIPASALNLTYPVSLDTAAAISLSIESSVGDSNQSSDYKGFPISAFD